MKYSILIIQFIIAAFSLKTEANQDFLNEKVQLFINETFELLPKQLINKTPSNISFNNLNNRDLDISDLQHCNPKVKLGYSNSKNNRVVLDNIFKNIIINDLLDLNSACFHGTLKKITQATLIHEVTHIYDFSKQNLTQRNRNFSLSDDAFILKQYNISQSSSTPDSYERKSPQEFLAVNMELYILDPEFACRRPAIFNFLNKHFYNFITPTCTNTNTVFVHSERGLHPRELNNVYEIHYLHAGKGAEIMSRWGHAMFRLVVCAPERIEPISKRILPATKYGPDCLKDTDFHLVVSYRANVDDIKLNPIKGLTGGYESKEFILNFNDVIKDYNWNELRDVFSFPLSINEEQKNSFINNVVHQYWAYSSKYKFLSNNCAHESHKLLQISIDEPDLYKKKILSPVSFLSSIQKYTHLSINEIMKNADLYQKLGYYYPSDQHKITNALINLTDRMSLATYLKKGSATLRSGQMLKELNQLILIDDKILKIKSLITIRKKIWSMIYLEQYNFSISKKDMLRRIYKIIDNNQIEILKSTTQVEPNKSKIIYGIPNQHELTNLSNEIHASTDASVFNELLKNNPDLSAKLVDINSAIKQLEGLITRVNTDYTQSMIALINERYSLLDAKEIQAILEETFNQKISVTLTNRWLNRLK